MHGLVFQVAEQVLNISKYSSVRSKMRASSLILSLSFILWFCFTTAKPFSPLASASEEPVTDINGDPLVAGQEYYIVSALWGAGGGGVNIAKDGDASSCSYYIFQEGRDIFRGAPVKFQVEGTSTDQKIYEGSTDLGIEFVNKPDCAESSKWVVAYESGSSSSSPRLVIGGPEDHPDSELVTGVFNIKAFSPIAYKLVFCPKSSTVGSSSGTCYDVELGTRRSLVVTQNSEFPFMLVFIKAESVKGKFSIM